MHWLALQSTIKMDHMLPNGISYSDVVAMLVFSVKRNVSHKICQFC